MVNFNILGGYIDFIIMERELKLEREVYSYFILKEVEEIVVIILNLIVVKIRWGMIILVLILF